MGCLIYKLQRGYKLQDETLWFKGFLEVSRVHEIQTAFLILTYCCHLVGNCLSSPQTRQRHYTIVTTVLPPTLLRRRARMGREGRQPVGYTNTQQWWHATVCDPITQDAEVHLRYTF